MDAMSVIEVQFTPNPNALKFVLSRPVTDQPISFFSADAAKGHPVASLLFAIDGVCSVLLLNDFVTVNKQPQAAWKSIRPRVSRVLADVR